MVLELAGGAAIAALVSLIACRALITAGPLDQPTAPRKAHATPTPTSGGIGIAIGFAVGLMTLALFNQNLHAELNARGSSLLVLTASFAYAFLIVGFWDDAHPLSAKLKFALFAVFSVAAAIAVGPVREFAFGAEPWVAPLWLATLGTALWIFTFVNCVNFMDGANGLAMGSVAVGLAALGLMAGEGGAIAGVAATLCAVGALVGFLFWNFPGGRLFAGDSGALFAGALAALVSLLVIHRTGISPLVAPIVFFPLLADVLLTLAWRVIRRRSLFDGHSEHLYQIAIRGGMSHAEIALTYWAAMAACGLIGVLAARQGGVAPYVALAALAGVSIIISFVVRRFADRRGVGGV